MRFYEKLLFHILKKDGLQYTTNGDQDYEDDEGEEEEIIFDECIKEDDLFDICDIVDNEDKREFFRKYVLRYLQIKIILKLLKLLMSIT
jgi:hypothetical protein